MKNDKRIVIGLEKKKKLTHKTAAIEKMKNKYTLNYLLLLVFFLSIQIMLKKNCFIFTYMWLFKS